MLPQHDTQAARVMPLQETTMTFQRIQVEPLTPTIGATVTGVDLNHTTYPAEACAPLEQRRPASGAGHADVNAGTKGASVAE